MSRALQASEIKARARELGFDACGIAPAAAHPELRFFAEWLSRGYAASMGYLSRSADTRADVRHVLPSARSVIALATLYNADRPYSTECANPERAHVARYAWGDDYHEVISRRLDALVAWMHERHPEPFEAAPYVDTGPVQERVYAQRAGIGWIGKNACVINERLGSFVFLAEIICSLPLEPDPPSLDQCGTCTLCLEACPTGALVAPGVLDSNRCISYLTIEHRGAIPDELVAAVGSHVYGCDVCQEVCPWNGAAPVSDDPSWQPRPAWDRPALVDLLQMDEGRLREALHGSAMKRARVDGLRRNLEVASANAAREKQREKSKVGG
jgi:epoxyqueuosine reductase